MLYADCLPYGYRQICLAYALHRRVGSSRHQKRVSALHCWSTRDESPTPPSLVVSTRGLAIASLWERLLVCYDITDLAGEWQICESRFMELDVRGLCVCGLRICKPLNKSCHFGAFMARHFPSWFCFHVTLKNVGGVGRETGKKANTKHHELNLASLVSWCLNMLDSQIIICKVRTAYSRRQHRRHVHLESCR